MRGSLHFAVPTRGFVRDDGFIWHHPTQTEPGWGTRRCGEHGHWAPATACVEDEDGSRTRGTSTSALWPAVRLTVTPCEARSRRTSGLRYSRLSRNCGSCAARMR